MIAKNSYDPAFPQGDPEFSGNSGMSLRAYIATQIYARIVNSKPICDRSRSDPWSVAGRAVNYADILIDALDKKAQVDIERLIKQEDERDTEKSD